MHQQSLPECQLNASLCVFERVHPWPWPLTPFQSVNPQQPGGELRSGERTPLVQVVIDQTTTRGQSCSRYDEIIHNLSITTTSLNNRLRRQTGCLRIRTTPTPLLKGRQIPGCCTERGDLSNRVTFAMWVNAAQLWRGPRRTHNVRPGRDRQKRYQDGIMHGSWLICRLS